MGRQQEPWPARVKATGRLGQEGLHRAMDTARLSPGWAGAKPDPKAIQANQGWQGRTAGEGRAPALHKKPPQGQGAETLSEEPEKQCQSCRRRAMEQYFSATQKMEQEVMFPSLLRGVFPQEEGAAPAAESRTDLYERYQLLKAIKPMVEKGLASVGDQSPSGAHTDMDTSLDSNEAEGAQLEERLSHHLTGLQQVLTHLTRDTNALTRRYSQILEQINLSEGQPSW